MTDPFQVVRDFEAALCEYTGAPYCVTTTSCTMALLLACAFMLHGPSRTGAKWPPGTRPAVEIPKRTYVGVPMSIVHAGGRPIFRDAEWAGWYMINPINVIDSARWLTGGMFNDTSINHLASRMVCLSFHWNKTLGLGQGGAILHANPEADKWLRKARFDGRTEGVPPFKDEFDTVGWHCYMSPETAAQGLVRLANLPKHNDPIPNDDYPDLSKLEIFK